MTFFQTSPALGPLCRLRNRRRSRESPTSTRAAEDSEPETDSPFYLSSVYVHCPASSVRAALRPAPLRSSAHRPWVARSAPLGGKQRDPQLLLPSARPFAHVIFRSLSVVSICVRLTVQRYCSVCSVQLLSATRVSRNTLHKRCKFCSDPRLRQSRPRGLKYREGCRSPGPPLELDLPDDGDSDSDVDTAPVSPAVPAAPSPALSPAPTAP